MKEEQKIYRLIAAHTTDLVCIHDDDTIIRYATNSSSEILGYSSEELLGKKLTDYLSEDFINEMDFTTLKRFFDNPGTRIRYQVRRKDQRLRWLESTFTKIAEDPKQEFSVLSTTRDITESVHLTDDLMDALSQEQELGRFKSTLYSVASHEFKTPLAVIQANIEMLKIKNSEKLLKSSLASMEEEIDHLNDMIADMLQLKKLTSGQTTFNPEETDLVTLIQDLVLSDIKKAYPNQKIVCHLPKTKICSADFSLMRYVFTNLLSNACKFNSKEGSISIDYSETKDFTIILIKDEGIGIPEEDQDKVFTSFYRANNVGTIGGTGIGLSIVKEFVEMHKGRIYFKSKLNEGSTFYVELPNKKP